MAIKVDAKVRFRYINRYFGYSTFEKYHPRTQKIEYTQTRPEFQWHNLRNDLKEVVKNPLEVAPQIAFSVAAFLFIFLGKHETARMIAFGGAIAAGSNTNAGGGAVTSFTFNNVAGNKMFVTTLGNVSGTDNTTAISYNSASLTRIGAGGVQIPADRIIGLWYKDSPATGSNTVAITGGGFCNAVAVSYTGCTTGIDSSASGTASAVSSKTQATTVVASNCWLVGVFANDTGAESAGTGAFERDAGPGSGNFTIYDSNGTVGTGSQSMQVTRDGGGNVAWAAIVASIAPVATTTANPHMLSSTGVGA